MMKLKKNTKNQLQVGKCNHNLFILLSLSVPPSLFTVQQQLGVNKPDVSTLLLDGVMEGNALLIALYR